MTTFVRLLQAQDSSLSDNLGGCLNRLQQILTSVPACADAPALPAFDDLNRSPQTTDLLDFEIIHNHPYFRSYHNPLYYQVSKKLLHTFHKRPELKTLFVSQLLQEAHSETGHHPTNTSHLPKRQSLSLANAACIACAARYLLRF